MILRYKLLSHHPCVFQSITGLRVPKFDELFQDVLPGHERAYRQHWKCNASSAANRHGCAPSGVARPLVWRRTIRFCSVQILLCSDFALCSLAAPVSHP